MRLTSTLGGANGLALAVAAATGLTATPALAGKLKLAPYAEYGVAADDNVFRVADHARAGSITGSNQRADVIRHATIGVLAQWPISRQKLTVAGQVSRYRYHRFDDLDHSENKIRTALKFHVGSAVSGTARYRRTRRLEDFANRDNTEPDFVHIDEPRIETFLKVTPHWRVRTRIGYLHLDHSLADQRRFNRREKQGVLALQYQDGAGSLVGAGVEYIDGEFPQRGPGDPLARKFEQTSPFARVDWAYSEISTLRARLGYTRRTTSGGGSRDFGGVTGRLAYDRELTGKTRLTLGLSRQIYSVDNVDANYLRETAARATLRWTYSPKLNLVAGFARRYQDYRSLPGARRSSRHDRLNELNAELVYQPISKLALVFNTSYEHRDSNRTGESYDVLAGGVALRVSWGGD